MLRVSQGELNENERASFGLQKQGFGVLSGFLLALGLVGAVFFMRRNTCTACPSLGTRLGQTWEPNRPVSTIGSIRAKASVSSCRLRMEPLTSAVGFPLRSRIPIHFQSRDFKSNDLSVTLSSRSEAASTGY